MRSPVYKKQKTNEEVLLGCIGCLLAIPIVLGIVYVVTWAFMFMWNFVVPEVFKGPRLDFWHAFALMWLLGFIGGYFRNLSSKD
jgi:hypothetical protein